ncbi:MAG: lipoprotein-releasing ABC transporter permease subunit [Gammaproteobacteria bacterium]|nr:lipoprotein-releasing ABC transporter permease subunit [Gammaproteobacteria bacterium]
MLKPFELFIGSRYLRAKRRNHFISFISLISLVGIALSIVVLITVLSVMNGFQHEVKHRILGMTSHASAYERDGILRDWQGLQKKLKNFSEVKGSAPFVQGQSMAVKGKKVNGVLLSGIDPEIEGRVSRLGEYMLDANLNVLRPGEFGILLGDDLADRLGVHTGEKISVITPEATVTPAGILPRLRRFTVVGIYSVGIPQYDQNTAAIHIEDAKRLFQLGDSVSGLRLKFEDLFDAPSLTRELRTYLGKEYWVTDWTQYNQNFFRALKIEKIMMAIILSLLVLIAAFNIVSALVMVVTEKQSDIAILRTLGASPKSIMGIFVIQGTVIGLVGTALGAVFGILLASNLEDIVGWIESIFNMKFLTDGFYPIDDLPSHINASDVVLVCAIAFVMSVLATVYPAWKASRTQPAEALRYE